MGQRTVVGSRLVGRASPEDGHLVACSKGSIDASARTDEASRDLAVQFLRMNRADRHASVVDDDVDDVDDEGVSVSPVASPIVTPFGHSRMAVDYQQSPERRHSFFGPGSKPYPFNGGVVDLSRTRDRPHSYFIPEATTSLPYRVKESAVGPPQATSRRHSSVPDPISTLLSRVKESPQNPRKHHRGSPSVDDSGGPGEADGGRYCKRISGDSGYGSDTRRRRRGLNKDPSSSQQPEVRVSRSPESAAYERDAALETDNKRPESLQPTGDIRKQITVNDTATAKIPTTRRPVSRQPVPVQSQTQQAKGLRRVKGTPTLRPEQKHNKVRPQSLRIEVPPKPGIDLRQAHLSDPFSRPAPLLPIPTTHEVPGPIPKKQSRPLSDPPPFRVNQKPIAACPEFSDSTPEETTEPSSDSDDDFSVDSGTFSIPDSPVEPYDLHPEDPFAPHLDAVVAKVLQQYHAWQARQRGGQAGRGRAQRANASNLDSSSQSKKRSYSGYPGQQPPSEDDDNVAPGSKRTKIPATSTTAGRTLACPFWKKDQDGYRRCSKMVLSQIKYVKQHLYRFHRAPIICACCGEGFTNEEAHAAHSRARRCSVIDHVVQPEGMTRDQQDRISLRAKREHSEEEKWFVIWDILFPGQPRPRSVYIDADLSEDLCNFREFYSSSGVDILLDYLETHAAPGYPRDSDGRIAIPPAVLQRGLDGIYDQWEARRGLRRAPPAQVITPPRTEPSNATESARASRASLGAAGLSELSGQGHGQEPVNRYMEDALLPVPASTFAFPGQDFEGLGYRNDVDYEADPHFFMADINNMLHMSAGRQGQYGQGPPGQSYMG